MKKVFEPVPDTVRQTAQETIGAVKDTIKGIEMKGEETDKAINEIEDLIKSAIKFDLRLVETLSEVATPEKTSQYRLQVNPPSKRFYTKKNVPIVFHGKSKTFFDSKKKFQLDGDVTDMMISSKFNAMSIDHRKDKKLLLDFLVGLRYDVEHTGNNKNWR